MLIGHQRGFWIASASDISSPVSVTPAGLIMKVPQALAIDISAVPPRLSSAPMPTWSHLRRPCRASQPW